MFATARTARIFLDCNCRRIVENRAMESLWKRTPPVTNAAKIKALVKYHNYRRSQRKFRSNKTPCNPLELSYSRSFQGADIATNVSVLIKGFSRYRRASLGSSLQDNISRITIASIRFLFSRHLAARLSDLIFYSSTK